MQEPKKRGRRPVENPLAYDLKVRVNKETLGKIEFCKNKLNVTRAEAIRAGIEKLFDDLKNK